MFANTHSSGKLGLLKQLLVIHSN